MFAKMAVFYREVRTEMSKVVWPTQEQVKTYTIVVIVSTALLATAIGIWDLGLTRIMGAVFGLDI